MTETQAKSGNKGTSANPVEEEAAQGGTPATGRAAVGRATVPADAPAPKFTRAPGMTPPPDKPGEDSGSRDSTETKVDAPTSADGLAAPAANSANATNTQAIKMPSASGRASTGTTGTQPRIGAGLGTATRRLDGLVAALRAAGLEVTEVEQEYVVDDSNLGLDHGWLDGPPPRPWRDERLETSRRAAPAGADAYPQGKDLYDAALLAEHTTVDLALVRDLLHRSQVTAAGTFTAERVLALQVDWANLTDEYPAVDGPAEDWRWRLALALERGWTLSRE